MDWFSTGLIMGAVQGLTEFLPVSSSGHLVIAGDLLGFTGPKASTFEVAIQLGSIFAVLMVYWDRFMGLLLPGRVQTSAPKPFAGVRGIWLLFLTTLPPSVLGLLLHSYIKQLFTPFSVSLSLAVGGLLMLFVEGYCAKRPPMYSSIDEVTPKLALGIGLVAGLFPLRFYDYGRDAAWREARSCRGIFVCGGGADHVCGHRLRSPQDVVPLHGG